MINKELHPYYNFSYLLIGLLIPITTYGLDPNGYLLIICLLTCIIGFFKFFMVTTSNGTRIHFISRLITLIAFIIMTNMLAVDADKVTEIIKFIFNGAFFILFQMVVHLHILKSLDKLNERINESISNNNINQASILLNLLHKKERNEFTKSLSNENQIKLMPYLI